MDDSFPVEFWHSDLFWVDEPISVPVPVRQTSAFVPYLSRPAIRIELENNPSTATTTATVDTCSNSRNLNQRVIQYWRKRWHERKEPAALALGDLEREKCHRHMLNERMRREKQRQSYFALHSMLPEKTKNDKNSIVQMAARTIQKLKASEEMLKRRNSELEMAVAAKRREKEKGKSTAINVTFANPSCGIDSMLAVLNVLKTVGINSKTIHATFFDSQFSAQLAIDTHMGAGEVERALQVTLSETERKFQRQMQGRRERSKQNPF